ncbi:flagellar assembly factor FliW [Geodermatophilus saharensis]|uniref:Flagellar assembly factor FliW n=1 Tax=Geodermatophilus saharensis TaxID=1137994 RepID=A0A239F219_9ACTN|nr:flagellar assembly protein FliW [Geodermatophilus saharensis]SNS50134.1 flagellar assembly factor FliW [Geodermatophilus saharensis]
MTLAPVVTLPLLGMVAPLPGFPDYRDYVLVTADGDGLLFWLQSMDTDGPRFLAIPPARWFPDYTPSLPRQVLADLDLDDAADALLFCLVTVPAEGVAAATANLRAPVVLNPANWRAGQVVLPDGRLPIRRPLRR